MKDLYVYGSENPKDNGKMHIADENGTVLCGVKIKWGECTALITEIENKQIYTIPFGKSKATTEIVLIWDEVKCKRCAKKINCL